MFDANFYYSKCESRTKKTTKPTKSANNSCFSYVHVLCLFFYESWMHMPIGYKKKLPGVSQCRTINIIEIIRKETKVCLNHFKYCKESRFLTVM